MTPRKVSAAALAAEWGTSVSSIIRLIEAGELPAANIAVNPAGRRRLVIDREDVERFLARRRVGPPPPAQPKQRKKAADVIEFV